MAELCSDFMLRIQTVLHEDRHCRPRVVAHQSPESRSREKHTNTRLAFIRTQKQTHIFIRLAPVHRSEMSTVRKINQQQTQFGFFHSSCSSIWCVCGLGVMGRSSARLASGSLRARSVFDKSCSHSLTITAKISRQASCARRGEEHTESETNEAHADQRRKKNHTYFYSHCMICCYCCWVLTR